MFAHIWLEFLLNCKDNNSDKNNANNNNTYLYLIGFSVQVRHWIHLSIRGSCRIQHWMHLTITSIASYETFELNKELIMIIIKITTFMLHMTLQLYISCYQCIPVVALSELLLSTHLAASEGWTAKLMLACG